MHVGEAEAEVVQEEEEELEAIQIEAVIQEVVELGEDFRLGVVVGEVVFLLVDQHVVVEEEDQWLVEECHLQRLNRKEHQLV